MRINSKPLIAALDIGSTKVSIIVAEVNQEGFKVVGRSKVPNKGVKQGSIVDIGNTTEAIRKARREAELNSGYEISEVYVSCGGLHVRSFDSDGMVAVEGVSVTQTDVDKVLYTAKAIVLPEDREIIHTIPREFILDGQGDIHNPIGMRGVRLETKVHLITGVRTSFPNLMNCVESAGLKVREFVLQQYASSMCVLGPEEKELGVCLVDIGGGTSDWIIHHQNAVVATGSVPVGGHNFTHDVSIGLRTAFAEAEKIKIDYGHCLPASSELEDLIEVPDVGGRGARTVARRNLCEIIAPRAQETLKLILDDIDRSGFRDHLSAGLVLTGGGCHLQGLVEFGTYNFDVPLRIGVPQVTTNVNEMIQLGEDACCVGLLIYGASKVDRRDLTKALKKSNSNNSFESFSKSFKEFIGL